MSNNPFAGPPQQQFAQPNNQGAANPLEDFLTMNSNPLSQQQQQQAQPQNQNQAGFDQFLNGGNQANFQNQPIGVFDQNSNNNNNGGNGDGGIGGLDPAFFASIKNAAQNLQDDPQSQPNTQEQQQPVKVPHDPGFFRASALEPPGQLPGQPQVANNQSKKEQDVAEAQQMFPETDLVILEDLYDQVGGDKELLVNMLLAVQAGEDPQKFLEQHVGQDEQQQPGQMQQSNDPFGQFGGMDEDTAMAQRLQEEEIQHYQTMRSKQKQQLEAQARQQNNDRNETDPAIDPSFLEGGRNGRDQGAYSFQSIQSRQGQNSGIQKDRKMQKRDNNNNINDIDEMGSGIGEKAPERKKKKFNIMDMFKGCISTKKNEPQDPKRKTKVPPQQQQSQAEGYASDDNQQFEQL